MNHGNYTHMSKHRITDPKITEKPFNGARSHIACDGHPEERQNTELTAFVGDAFKIITHGLTSTTNLRREFINKRAQRAPGRSPEKKVKGQDEEDH